MSGGTPIAAEPQPVPYDAYYRIGSDTKTFVAVVALQLAAAVFTTRLDDEKRFIEQAKATIELIDRAVCGRSGQ